MARQQNEGQVAFIRQLLYVLNQLIRVRGTITARSAQAFLLVAEEEGLSVSEYARLADMPITTMSRTLIDMSECDSRFAEGSGLIEGRDNPENRREKIYRLTTKGRGVLATVLRAVKA